MESNEKKKNNDNKLSKQDEKDDVKFSIFIKKSKNLSFNSKISNNVSNLIQRMMKKNAYKKSDLNLSTKIIPNNPEKHLIHRQRTFQVKRNESMDLKSVPSISNKSNQMEDGMTPISQDSFLSFSKHKKFSNDDDMISGGIKKNKNHLQQAEIKNNEESSMTIINRIYKKDDQNLKNLPCNHFINRNEDDKLNTNIKVFQLKNLKTKSEIKETGLIHRGKMGNLKKYRKVFDSFSEEEDDTYLHQELTGIIFPNSFFKKRWDILMLIMIIYSIFVIPYKIAFDLYTNDSFYLIIDSIIDIFFCADIVLSFFTGYYDEYELIVSRPKIVKNYLKSWFLPDFISGFPISLLEIVFYKNNQLFNKFNQIGRILRLFKWVRVFRIIKVFKNEKNKISKILKKISSSLARVLKLIMMLILVCHLTSCLFIFIGKNGDILGNWIYRSNLNDQSNYDIFVAAVYFSFTTIFTVGYGDITASSTIEIIYVIFLLTIGCAIFSYALSSFANAMIENDTKTQIFNKKEKILDEIDLEFIIPEELYYNLKKAITYDYLKWNEDYICFISSLPSIVKNQLFIKIYKSQIQILQFFEKKSYDFIIYVIPLLKSGKFYKGDIVIQIGEIVEEMYLVCKGSLSIQLDTKYNNFELGLINTGYHFGDILMYSNEQSNYNLKIRKKCAEVMIFKKSDFAQAKLLFSNEVNHILRKSLEIFSEIEKRRFEVFNYYQNNNNSIKGFKLKKNFDSELNQNQIQTDSQLDMKKDEDKLIKLINENLNEDEFIEEKIDNLKNNNSLTFKLRLSSSKTLPSSPKNNLILNNQIKGKSKTSCENFWKKNISRKSKSPEMELSNHNFPMINTEVNKSKIPICPNSPIGASKKSVSCNNINKMNIKINTNLQTNNVKIKYNENLNIQQPKKSSNNLTTIFRKSPNNLKTPDFIMPKRKKSEFLKPSNFLRLNKINPKFNMMENISKDEFLDELNDKIKNEGFLNKNHEIVQDYLKDYLDLKGSETKFLKRQNTRLKSIVNNVKKIIKNYKID